ncbi:MAG: glycosyltransferase [bacterium]
MITSSHPVNYSRFWDREARSLSRAGYRVTIIGLGEKFKVESVDNIKTISIPEQKKWNKVILIKKIAHLAFQEQADVYQCLDPWCLGIGLWLQRNHPKINLVYESSEWFPQTYLDRTDLPFVLRLLGWLLITQLEYTATRKASAIIETNKTRSYRFIRRGRTPFLVPNYPPIESIGSPLNERNPWFVYTGLVCRPRGFDKLLQALALVVKKGFSQVKLIVRGEFDPREDIENWTREFISRNNLHENVTFIARKNSYSQIFDLIKPCLAGVILFQPNRGNDWTNQPNKLFEFMGCGLAVIASNFPEIARVICETKCGWLVDPTQPEMISDTMISLLKNPADCIQRGIAGRKAVENKYHWQVAETSLLNLYQQLFRQ